MLNTSEPDKSLKLNRVPRWEIALAKWVEASMGRPFQWGRFDCGLMAADAIEAITGIKVADDLQYETEEGAKAIVGEDFSSLQELCDERVGVEIRPTSARKGDIAMVEFNDGEAYSLVVDYGRSYIVATDKGVRIVRKEAVKAVKAWRVG